jgi:hypothetical protein
MTVEENAKLEEVFTEEEVKTTVFGSYLDGAPGPDGLNFSFYIKKLGPDQRGFHGYVL